eukprot:s693_g16.t1
MSTTQDWYGHPTAWASRQDWQPRSRRRDAERDATRASRLRPNATTAAPEADEEVLTATAEVELPLPASATQNAHPARTEAQGELQAAGAGVDADSHKELSVELLDPMEPEPATEGRDVEKLGGTFPHRRGVVGNRREMGIELENGHDFRMEISWEYLLGGSSQVTGE